MRKRLFSTTRQVLKAQILPLSRLSDRAIPHYSPLNNKTNLYSLVWDSPPQNVCVIKKPWNPNVRSALVQFILHIHHKYPKVNLIVERDAAEEIEPDVPDSVRLYTGLPHELQSKTDLLVTLGGDGTILHAASLFSSASYVPPVLSFSMGTLGFLLPFDFEHADEAFRSVYSSQCSVLNRFRLQCTNVSSSDSKTSITHAMNDITIHRGQEPHLTMLDIFVEGEFVTTAIADGVTIATPTGSTAYSLSSGGSIVHPSVSCILITPICPRSLSFRPLVFPASANITISVSPQSRGRAAEFSADGIRKGSLKPGDTIQVGRETGIMKGVWCVTRTDSDWTHQLNHLLGFNSTFGVRHYELSTPRSNTDL